MSNADFRFLATLLENRRPDGFPPRGSGTEGQREEPQSARWSKPGELGRKWGWSPGKLIFGRSGVTMVCDPDRPQASGDDRHVVTIAGSRTGKSSTVLVPNLLGYPGSMIVLDPKGDLARETGPRREAMGHEVVVLDPFGASGLASGSYDPLAQLDPDADTFIDDVGLVADALIVDQERDPHWTDAGKALVVACILFMFASGDASLPRLRRMLLGAEGALGKSEDDGEPTDTLFETIAGCAGLDGLVAAMGQSFRDKSERELGSIVSVAREQTRFLDSSPLQQVLTPSSLRLGDLKARPVTIYLCLPAGRLATHFRWLRLIVTLGLIELEKSQLRAPHPVIFLMEEFAALQKLQAIERAAGFMAGFGVRLWVVLQDLGQLKSVYPRSWETFIGNAGLIQAFGNLDLTTTDHLSRLLGRTTIVEQQKVWVSAQGMAAGDTGLREHVREVPLLDPSEIARYFARETNRQVLLHPGERPIYCERLPLGFDPIEHGGLYE